jgi:hypothetical protein
MKVKDAVAACTEFCNLAGASAPSIQFSKPWQPKDRTTERVPHENTGGIYLFSEPVASEPTAAAEDSEGEVWYVGTSRANMGSRIWAHLGPVYDPATGAVFDPPFKAHAWVSRPNKPANMLSTIATGHVVVYAASVEPNGNQPGWAVVLEKFLLVKSYLLYRRIPTLNADM